MNAILTARTFHSITSKLTLFMALASGLALLVCCGAFVYNDVLMLRENKARELRSVAEVMASNSTAALAFGQRESAAALLKSLGGRSDLQAARLFDAGGGLFAEHTAHSTAGQANPAVDVNRLASEREAYRWAENGTLEVTLPVFDQGQTLGYVQLQVRASDLHGQLYRYSGIAASVVLASLLFTIVLGVRSQRFVSDPLLRLAQAFKQVQDDGDYTIRVEKPSNDEIGQLYEEFNALLARIAHIDAAQQRTHAKLRDEYAGFEERERKRTDQLLQARAELERSEERLLSIIETVRDSELTELNDVLQVVNEQRDDLAGFLETDRRGKQLPRELLEAGRAVAQQRDSVLEQLDAVTKDIGQIKLIVAPQPLFPSR